MRGWRGMGRFGMRLGDKVGGCGKHLVDLKVRNVACEPLSRTTLIGNEYGHPKEGKFV
jgi:hypothetical protein